LPPSFHCYPHLPPLHSFPTRRSSDLPSRQQQDCQAAPGAGAVARTAPVLRRLSRGRRRTSGLARGAPARRVSARPPRNRMEPVRSEEHTSELQSRENLVCRLLLEKKK